MHTVPLPPPPLPSFLRLTRLSLAASPAVPTPSALPPCPLAAFLLCRCVLARVTGSLVLVIQGARCAREQRETFRSGIGETQCAAAARVAARRVAARQRGACVAGSRVKRYKWAEQGRGHAAEGMLHGPRPRPAASLRRARGPNHQGAGCSAVCEETSNRCRAGRGVLGMYRWHGAAERKGCARRGWKGQKGAGKKGETGRGGEERWVEWCGGQFCSSARLGCVCAWHGQGTKAIEGRDEGPG